MSLEELELTKESFLLSETDEKGIIKYANDEFCEYSGYSLDELIGKPHNCVRHSEMPKEAFQDLWNTIKKGNPWKGFVKNRSKNGQFYWVFATVFPFVAGDGNKGYISCRRMASRDEISKYENLYKSMN